MAERCQDLFCCIINAAATHGNDTDDDLGQGTNPSQEFGGHTDRMDVGDDTDESNWIRIVIKRWDWAAKAK